MKTKLSTLTKNIRFIIASSVAVSAISATPVFA